MSLHPRPRWVANWRSFNEQEESRSRWGDLAGRAGPAVALEPRQSRLAVALGQSRSRSRWAEAAGCGRDGVESGRAGRRPLAVALGGGRSRSCWADAAVGWSPVPGRRAGGGGAAAGGVGGGVGEQSGWGPE